MWETLLTVLSGVISKIALGFITQVKTDAAIREQAITDAATTTQQVITDTADARSSITDSANADALVERMRAAADKARSGH